jgi:hypothetical protein
MGSYFRLRQICLVASELTRVIADTESIFGVKLAYRDPHVLKYGLENALFPFGLAFVEIVSPREPNTAAGRFLDRRGDGGGAYMAIFNCNDPERRGRHAEAMGIRISHTIDHEGFHAVQMHPRDCRATMIEFNRTDGEKDLQGPYLPAGGKNWREAIKSDVTKGLVEIVVESPDPRDIGAHWSRILEKPCILSGESCRIDTDMIAIRFVRGEGERETLRRLVVEVADKSGMERRALQRGHRVTDAGIEYCGVTFQLVV